jgi:hypothetical protein
MKGKVYYLAIFFITFLCSACPKENSDDCHCSIIIINNSNFSIYFDISPDKPGSPNALVHNQTFNKIESRESKKYEERSCIEYDFTKGTTFYDGSFRPLDSLRVYIFDAQVLEHDLKFKLLRKYDLSLKDLQNLNWTITYQPIEDQ